MTKPTSSLSRLDFEPVRQSTLSDHVYARLSELIITGKIKSGQHLIEQTLANQLHVSKISVREAIRSLAMDGLVKIIPRRGAYVTQLSLDDILEIYQLRAAIESMAIELATENLDSNGIKTLQNVIQQMQSPEIMENRLSGAMLDTQFHQTIMSLSGHERGIKIWKQMGSQIQMVLYTVSNYYPNYSLIADRHQNLLTIMISGDGKKASENIRIHILEGAKRLLESIEQRDE